MSSEHDLSDKHGCGYDHGDEHGCGHDHEDSYGIDGSHHSHGHVHTEDGACPAVYSVRAEWDFGGEVSLQGCADRLERITGAVADAANARGWLIGHIKAHLAADAGEVWFSSIGTGVTRQVAPSGSGAQTGAVLDAQTGNESDMRAGAEPSSQTGTCRVGLTAIVFGPDEEALAAVIKPLFL